jgi:hypothetical protein
MSVVGALFGPNPHSRQSKLTIFCGILAVLFALAFTACDIEPETDPDTGAPQSVTYFSEDGDGNFYTLVITENTGRSARYIPQNGDSFTFTVELFNNGNYSVALTYSGTVESAAEKSGTEIEIKITVNGEELTITVSGTDMTVIKGKIVDDNGETVVETPETLTPMNAPEDWPVAKRWWKWIADDATATLDYSVDTDGVCTITVGGIAQSNDNTDNWGRWKTNASYNYTTEANKRYVYEFEAWTQSGTRDLNFQYYNTWGDWDSEGATLARYPQINDTRETYTVYGEKLPRGGIRQLEFQCADQLGIFYVKILSIKEYDISELDNVPPEEKPEDARWSKWVADDTNATLNYSLAPNNVCTITVGGKADPTRWKTSAQYSYTAKANASYDYVFDAWTQSGTRTLNVQYYNGTHSDEDVWLGQEITITPTRQQYVIHGDNIPQGRVCLVEFQCADKTGTFYIAYGPMMWEYDAPEDWPVEDRWRIWVDPASRTTLDYSVADDGVCTITVGGTGEPGDILAGYSYTAKANTRYVYKFEAWTQSGSRWIDYVYYWDDDSHTGLSTNFTLTNIRQTYTITGDSIPKSGREGLDFHMGTQLGTFYVKILSITPYDG